jgi:hypothetical protein
MPTVPHLSSMGNAVIAEVGQRTHPKLVRMKMVRDVSKEAACCPLSGCASASDFLRHHNRA